MIGNYNDKTNFSHKVLLTDRQISKVCKTELSKIVQSRGFLDRLLAPLLKTGLPLIKNIFMPLTKNILILLGLWAAASAADTGIHKKIIGLETTT